MIKKEALEAIQGEKLKYSELCRRLNIPAKAGNSKKPQLEEIRLYCDLEEDKSRYPTRYIVKEVYPIVFDLRIHNNNKYQVLFEAVLYQAFLRNHSEPLHLSNMEMLRLFQEVNENFAYACNREHMDRLSEIMQQDFQYMTDIGQIVYKILRQWTRRKVQAMEKRKIILTRPGFRLYSSHVGQYGEYILGHKVWPDSNTEKLCQEVYSQAVQEVLPEDWAGEWVNEKLWAKFESRLKELIRAKSKNTYVDLKTIIILSPPSESWLKDRLQEIYKAIPALDEINNEACDKILTTSQLDTMTNVQRRNFVEYNIKQNPAVSFRAKLTTESIRGE